MISLLALIAGAILPLAFAPFNWYPIAFISPAVLFFVIEHSTSRQALYRGFYFGVGLFGVGASWIYISIHRFGNANLLLAMLITAIFVAILALFPALQSYLYRRWFTKKSMVIRALLAFPALWVSWEWIRSWLFTGFPWLFLGTTQINSPLRGYIPWIGVYGASLLTVVISGTIAILFFYKRYQTKIVSVLIMVCLLISGQLLVHKSFMTTEGETRTVSLIQGNISQDIKWDLSKVMHILSVYKDETLKHISSNIIVWPEAAIPVYQEQVVDYLKGLNALAELHQVTLIFGIPVHQADTQEVFNGMMVLGNGQGIYLKRHLVPFGEYIPLKSWFNNLMRYFDIPMSDLSKGPKHPGLMFADDVPFAAFICYEIAYSNDVLKNVVNKAFIVVISDDSWFGHSAAASQQLQMAQMRALETGRYILYSTNTGVTAIINPQGQISKMIPKDIQMVLSGKISLVTGNTPLMHWRYYPISIVILMMLLIALL